MTLVIIFALLASFALNAYQFNSQINFLFESNQTAPFQVECPDNLEKVNTVDCSRNHSFLFTQFYRTIELLNDTTCEYANITIEYGSNLDIYSPPSYLQMVVNGAIKQAVLPTQPWGTLGNCMKKVVFNVTGNRVVNGLNSIQLIDLNNIVCIHLFQVNFHLITTLPDIISLFPTSAPITGGSNIQIVTEPFVELNRKLSCYFGSIESEFRMVDETHGYCITPPLDSLSNWKNVIVMLERPQMQISLTSSVISMNFYNLTLKEASLSSFSGFQVILIKGSGFLPTNEAKCVIENINGEFIIKAISGGNHTLFCHVDDIISKLYNTTIKIGIALNGQDESNSHLFLSIPIKDYEDDDTASKIVAILIITISVGVLVFVTCLILWCIIKSIKKNPSSLEDLINPNEVVCEITLGKGSYGDVWRATWRGQKVAVKLIPTRTMVEDNILEFAKEVQVMKNLRHPCVLQFFGSGTDANYILIVMELMERGSVRSILADKSIYLSWKRRLRMLHDAASGMYYLHTRDPPIIHRDLKSHNLLVDSLWRVKVSDFGLSVSAKSDEMIRTSVCGTLAWIAPEILSRKPYCQKVDVYSFGIVMWEFLTRDIPYKNLPPKSIPEYVINTRLRPKIPEDVDLIYASLMTKCWSEEPTLRPNFREIVDTLTSFISSDLEVAPLN